jgi:hypothetical protein
MYYQNIFSNFKKKKNQNILTNVAKSLIQIVFFFLKKKCRKLLDIPNNILKCHEKPYI